MQKLKNRLETATGKKVTADGKTAKVHLKELDGLDLFNLHRIVIDLNINPTQMKLKRSGTGIIILVTLN